MKLKALTVLIASALLIGCNSDDGKNGTDGKDNIAVNTQPNTIPSLQFWSGKKGNTDVTPSSRFILNADDADTLMQLTGMATLFNQDLKALNGMELEIVPNGGQGEPGDIVFNVTGFTAPAHDLAAHDESYTIDIDGTVIINAPEMRGAAYAAATLKQMLVQDFDGKDSLANGLIQDEPKMRVRGLMLDMGRRSISKEFVINYLKMMSYYKMSELQMHITDNKILKGHPDQPDLPDEANWSWDTWQTDYAGFYVELKGTEQFPELANVTSKHDPANGRFVLTIQDIKELRQLADSLGIELTAEVEAPAHAMAITQAFPDLAHKEMKPDHLDLGKPKTLEVVKAIWEQVYPYFHNVHIGADEYSGDPKDWTKPSQDSEDLVNYMNTLNEYLKSKGHTQIRVWGNWGQLAFPNRDKLSRDIVQQPWWGQPAMTHDAYKHGFKLINTNHIWYTVPTSAGACYPDMIDPKHMYDNYRADTFSSWERDVNKWGKQVMFQMDVADPQFLGATVALWNDNGHYDKYSYSDADIHERLRNKVKIAAQNMWNNKTVLEYPQFMNLAYTLGESPSFNLKTVTTDNTEANLSKGKSAYSSSYKNTNLYPISCSNKDPIQAGIDMEHLKDTNFNGHAGSAIDGDTKSRWMAALTDSSSAWLSVDLQHPQTISRVSIDWGKGWASKYQIQVSNDGFAWQTVATVAGAGMANEETTFEPIEARFVKMQGVAMGTEDVYQIHEMRVFK